MTRLILLHENTTFASHPVIKKQFLIVAPRPEIQLLAVTGFTRRLRELKAISYRQVHDTGVDSCAQQARTLLLATSTGLVPQFDP